MRGLIVQTAVEQLLEGGTQNCSIASFPTASTSFSRFSAGMVIPSRIIGISFVSCMFVEINDLESFE